MWGLGCSCGVMRIDSVTGSTDCGKGSEGIGTIYARPGMFENSMRRLFVNAECGIGRKGAVFREEGEGAE